MVNAKPQEMNKANQTITPELELVNKWTKNLYILPPFTQKLFVQKLLYFCKNNTKYSQSLPPLTSCVCCTIQVIHLYLNLF